MKLINFIVCEDIRAEEGNKISIIGVPLSDTFESSKYPVQMRLANYIQIKREEDFQLGSFLIEIISNKEVIFSINSKVNNDKSNLADILTISFLIKSLELKEPCELVYKISIFNQNEELIRELTPEYKLKFKLKEDV